MITRFVSPVIGSVYVTVTKQLHLAHEKPQRHYIKPASRQSALGPLSFPPCTFSCLSPLLHAQVRAWE